MTGETGPEVRILFSAPTKKHPFRVLFCWYGLRLLKRIRGTSCPLNKTLAMSCRGEISKRITHAFAMTECKEYRTLREKAVLRKQNALPYHVQFVNEQKFDSFINDNRELDILAKRCIIEVNNSKNSSFLEKPLFKMLTHFIKEYEK